MGTERELFLPQAVAPYHVAMHGLISLMADDAAANSGRVGRGGILAQCVLAGPGYAVRIVCRNRGIRPFLALMDTPVPKRCYLGRLTRDGSCHIFEHGIRGFYTILLAGEVLYPFLAEVREAIRHYAPTRTPGAPDSPGQTISRHQSQH